MDSSVSPTKPTKAPNRGYCVEWAERNLNRWERFIERRAGGVNPQIAYSAQHFTLTNMSSLTAMLAATVYCHLRGDKCAEGENVPEFAKFPGFTEAMTRAFEGIRVTIMLGAVADEIENVNEDENAAKAKEKVFCELDCIMAVRRWQKNIATENFFGVDRAEKITPAEISKYACVLTDPKAAPPQWLQTLLAAKGLKNTLRNRVSVVGDKKITCKWLAEAKATGFHPILNGYTTISLRHRFLRGFHPGAVDKMFALWSSLGRRGLAPYGFPLSRATLLSPGLLSTAAFGRGREQDAVPAYLDGAPGQVLQERMVADLEKRSTDAARKSKKEGFQSWQHWLAYGRLMPVVCNVLRDEFGQDERTWPDGPRTLHTQLEQGQWDGDLAKLSGVLRGELDSNPSALAKLLQSGFGELNRVCTAEKLSAAMRESVQPPPAPPADAAEGNAEASGSAGSSGSAGVVAADGDVTDALAKALSAAERKKLAADLSATAKKERAAAARLAVCNESARKMRNCVHYFRSVAGVKEWMTANSRGYTARVVVLDIGQSAAHQCLGGKRVLVSNPSKEKCEEWYKDILCIPVTPVVGSVMVRGCGKSNVFYLDTALGKVFKYRRGLVVPLAASETTMGKWRSGATRMFGPDAGEKEAVDFLIRTAGLRGTEAGDDDDVAVGGPEAAPVDDEPAAEGEDEDEEETADMNEEEQAFVAKLDPSLLNDQGLKEAFGKNAAAVRSALFQFSSRISSAGRFMEPRDVFKIQTGRAQARAYRRAQLHPDTYYRAYQAAVGTHALPVGKTEVVVVLTGGTPEAVVSALAAGYSNVCVVCADGAEMDMYRAPPDAADADARCDYDQYVSWDPTNTTAGILFACGVRQLAAYVENYLYRNASDIVVPVVGNFSLPPLKTYTYNAITNTIISRTVLDEAEKAEPASAAATPNAKKRGQSDAPASGTPLTGDAKKAKVVSLDIEDSAGGEEDDDIDLPEAGEDSQEGGDLDDELAQVDSALAGKAKGKKKKKAAAKK